MTPLARSFARQMAEQRSLKAQLAQLEHLLLQAADAADAGARVLAFIGPLGRCSQGALCQTDGAPLARWHDPDARPGARLELAIPVLLGARALASLTLVAPGALDAPLQALLGQAVPLLARRLDLLAGGQAADSVLPAALAGIDLQAGLATAAGDPVLYRKLLRLFARDYPDFLACFRQARVADDARAATRLAHSLRGSAGNIGAFGVAAAAQELERLCAQDGTADALSAALAATVHALEEVLPGLNALQAPVGPGAAAVPDPQWARKLARLRQLLLESDADAVELAGALAASAPPGQAIALAQVVSALERFDFDAALDRLPAMPADAA